jgi:acetyl esterase/lipase
VSGAAEASDAEVSDAEVSGARRTLAYGGDPDQVGDLLLPSGVPSRAGWPLAVLLHGGFWRERYRRDLMDPLAADLAGRGWAVWNLEYRRVRGAGGWPWTFTDVADGLDHLATLAAEPPATSPIDPVGSVQPPSRAWLDLAAVTVIGHSAGGHLALWAAGRELLPDSAPGARPLVRPARVVALAPVADLRAADAAELSEGAVRELLGGGPDEHPLRWQGTDPVGLVGHGIPVRLVHGERDEDVPLAQSKRYHQVAARAGDPVALTTGPWDHMDLVDPSSPGWHAARRWLTHGTEGPGTPVRVRPPRLGSP